ncbi:MAG: LVIVD repeat-containing protein [Saprospiraceae bacterium]
METRSIYIVAIFMGLSLASCQWSTEIETKEVLVGKPITMSLDELHASTAALLPEPIQNSGKIYAYQNYIFINDLYRGIHVIDNTDPSNPEKIRFINIPGNVDLSIKDNFLYADCLRDLVVMDITDIHNIRLVTRLEGVLQDNTPWPFEADLVEYGDFDYQNEVIVGWELVKEERKVDEIQSRIDNIVTFDSFSESANGGGTGEGGSLARFKMVGDYLYIVDWHNINIVKISNLEKPEVLESVFAGFDIETIFNRGQHLFLGSRSGMYIYDISTPEKPDFVSEFQHGTACDPVVVDDQYAYVTLRGGNDCGATERGLYIIDISDLKKPFEVKSYAMEGPYGLGIKDNLIFICDGEAGLKVYNKANVLDLKLVNHFADIQTYDVIPLNEHLLMVGDNHLYQYEYLDDHIQLLSSFSLLD